MSMPSEAAARALTAAIDAKDVAAVKTTLAPYAAQPDDVAGFILTLNVPRLQAVAAMLPRGTAGFETVADMVHDRTDVIPQVLGALGLQENTPETDKVLSEVGAAGLTADFVRSNPDVKGVRFFVQKKLAPTPKDVGELRKAAKDAVGSRLGTNTNIETFNNEADLDSAIAALPEGVVGIVIPGQDDADMDMINRAKNLSGVTIMPRVANLNVMLTGKDKSSIGTARQVFRFGLEAEGLRELRAKGVVLTTESAHVKDAAATWSTLSGTPIDASAILAIVPLTQNDNPADRINAIRKLAILLPHPSAADYSADLQQALIFGHFA
jgi:hypothetical protein